MIYCLLDNRGIPEFCKRYGTEETNDLSSIAVTSDGGVILSGRAKYDGTTYGPHLTKVSQDGTIVWSKVYSFSTISTSSAMIYSIPN